MRHQQSTPEVPKIRVTGSVISSTAMTPSNQPDTCASWKPSTLKTVKSLLTNGKPVVCKDATAYAAVLALSIDLMIHGGLPFTSKIERAYAPRCCDFCGAKEGSPHHDLESRDSDKPVILHTVTVREKSSFTPGRPVSKLRLLCALCKNGL